MRTLRAYGHLDADCFYVSAERVRDAFLLRKPVGVLGNQGACVIAKSYEMKAAGVKTGTPIWEALELCPAGIYVKRDFRWYEVLSRRMLQVMRQRSPAVEYYSIDEFFFEALPERGQSLQELAESLRDQVLREAGVPVTVGIARTRTLAKLISDTAKPFGALALTDPEAERALLGGLPVTEVCGIAQRRAERLAPHGINTCLDLALADRRLVRWLLTVVGEGIWYELNGDPVLALHTDRPPQVEELEFHVVRAGALSVYLMHKDGSEGLGRAELPSPTDRFDLLLEAASRCFGHAWPRGRAVTRMHVTASQLKRPGFVQLGLFDAPADQARAVASVKREINEALGRFALRSGATLPLTDVYRDEAQQYDICDVRGKICF